MRLLGVELSRFVSRRAVAVLLLAVAVLTALLVTSAAVATRPADATERAVAEQSLSRELEASRPDYTACLDDPVRALGPGATAQSCRNTRPTIDWFLARPELDLADQVENRGTVLLVMLAAAAVLLGATFAGADWASGTMTNQLLFQPARLRVWLTKAVAVVVATTTASAVLVAAFWLALSLVAASRGLTTSSETWAEILQTSGRGLALVAAVSLGSFALTMLLRSTVGTLGLLFGYAVVGEGLAASLPFSRMSQWSMSKNVLAWIQDDLRVFDKSICKSQGPSCSPWYDLGLTHAAYYLGVLLLLAVLFSMLLFRTRDVR